LLLSKLPPTLIQIGGDEITYHDALDFHKKVIASGVGSQLQVYTDMMHGWHMFSKKLSESLDAIKNVADFIKGEWDA